VASEGGMLPIGRLRLSPLPKAAPKGARSALPRRGLITCVWYSILVF
jgi:hypothetical protein